MPLFNSPGMPVLALGLCVGAQRLLQLLPPSLPSSLFMFMLRSNIFGLRKMLINCDSIGSGREGRGAREECRGKHWLGEAAYSSSEHLCGCFDLVPLVPLPTLSDASAGRHLANVPHAVALLPPSPSPHPTRLYILFKAGCYMRGKNSSTRSRGRVRGVGDKR